MHEPLGSDQWKALASQLLQSGIFLPDGAEIWARSGFRCEYCDTDLLASPQVYAFGQADHILPASKYPHLKRDFNNYAQTCGLCNMLKRAWDPCGEADYCSVPSLSEEQRSMLSDRCREHLEPMLARVRDERIRILAILQQQGLR
jgi:hypothetical protein